MQKKVLLVEDNPTQAIKTRDVLESRNYQVIMAGTGLEGLHKASEIRPDLIVLDSSLPNLSGFDVCKQLKHNLKLKAIPVIMYSQESRIKNMVAAYEVGADYFIVKNDEGERVLSLLIDTVFTRLNRRVLQFS